MKVVKVEKIEEKYLQYDITTDTSNFFSRVGKDSVLLHNSPAIFCGTDPIDGKFFVGTKSVFAKTPKVYKTQADIDANESGGKAEKLKVALEELPKIGIPKDTVLQGDLLWTQGDLRYETINGVRYITAHPNTIVYAWPAESDIGKKISQARLGIVFHTTYRGRGELANYGATFGANVSKLRSSRTCWFDDAFFKGADVAFSEKEYSDLFSYTMKASKLIGGFDRIVDIMNNIPSAAAGANIKTFINSYIRKGSYPTPGKAFEEYVSYLKTYWEDKIVSKVKTDKAKDQKRVQLEQLLNELQTNKAAVVKSLDYVHLITQAKMIVVNKINQLNKQAMFVKTKDGYKVTAPEGYVAINSKDGSAVKFVDRLNFSHFNFSDEYIKGWQR